MPLSSHTNLVRVCAWCQADGIGPPPGANQTHGLCQVHLTRMFFEQIGALAAKPLADGRIAAIIPQLFGAKIVVSRWHDSYDEAWGYHNLDAAVAALWDWEPLPGTAPAGWMWYRSSPPG